MCKENVFFKLYSILYKPNRALSRNESYFVTLCIWNLWNFFNVRNIIKTILIPFSFSLEFSATSIWFLQLIFLFHKHRSKLSFWTMGASATCGIFISLQLQQNCQSLVHSLLNVLEMQNLCFKTVSKLLLLWKSRWHYFLTYYLKELIDKYIC